MDTIPRIGARLPETFYCRGRKDLGFSLDVRSEYFKEEL